MKRALVLNFIRNKKLNVTFLQETHSSPDNELKRKRERTGDGVFSHKTSNSGAVGILFSKDFEPVAHHVDEVVPEHLQRFCVVFESVKMFFIDVYAPTLPSERLLFLDTLHTVLHNCNSEEYVVVGGDFNFTENPSLDRNHPEPHAASKRSLITLKENFDLCDVWRFFHPNQRQYTWSHCKDKFLSLARLDRVYCFAHHINVFKKLQNISSWLFRSFPCCCINLHQKSEM